MFTRRPSKTESFSKKTESLSRKGGRVKGSFREHAVSRNRNEKSHTRKPPTEEPARDNRLTAAIITLVVGPEQRIFAAHEDVLTISPFFQAAISQQFLASPAYSPISPSGGPSSKRLALPDESPEIFSSVLEFLYKGDYYPRLILNKRNNTWEIERGENGEVVQSIIWHPSLTSSGEELLKDTAVYCAAEKYGLSELKKIALRKQGLQSGIQCSTIITSARYAYGNTPDTDSKLRAHYLALIIRSRNTFKRSGTMQMEMCKGGSQLFFDLFVALCNHVDDVATAQNPPHNLRHM